MFYYVISALFNFVVSLLLGVFVMYKNHKAQLNKALFFWCLSVASWSFFYFIWQLETQEELALLWTRLLMVGAVWVPVTYFNVVLVFLEIKKKYKNFLWFNYLLTILFAVLLATPLMVSHVEPVAGFDFWPKPGFAYSFFLVYFLGLSTYAAYLSFKALHTEIRPLKKAQIKYMLLGIAISIVGGSSNYFLWYDIPIPPYGNIFASTFVIFTIYAILRYRLMDIRVAAREIFLYTGAAAFSYGMFYLVVWFFTAVFGSVHEPGAYVAGLAISPAFVLALLGVIHVFKGFADRYFFADLYDSQKTITRLADELNYHTDLDRIVSLIIATIKQTLRLDRAGVLLAESGGKTVRYKVAKVEGFDKTNGISLVRSNALTKHLQESRKPLIFDEVVLFSRGAATGRERRAFEAMADHMKRIEASVCLPLISHDELIGIIVLGEKLSGDAYTTADLELLNTVAKQAGVAVSNARLYREVETFNATLQEKVDEQTKHLSELLKMKNEFLTVVHHQLNTPISIMKGYFSMMQEGSYSSSEALPPIRSALERIDRTVAEFRDAYELEGEHMRMDPEKTDIAAMVQAQVNEKKRSSLARERGLDMKVEESAASLPHVWCDPKKILHVISNLLDNAVQYTRKGFVTISYELLDGFVKVIVSDTGVGISKKDETRLFGKFSRGKNATDLRADGSGLGLFIAKRIVEENGGQISYFSEGKNKGSVFWFTLPVYTGQVAESGEKKAVSREKIIVFGK